MRRQAGSERSLNLVLAWACPSAVAMTGRSAEARDRAYLQRRMIRRRGHWEQFEKPCAYPWQRSADLVRCFFVPWERSADLVRCFFVLLHGIWAHSVAPDVRQKRGLLFFYALFFLFCRLYEKSVWQADNTPLICVTSDCLWTTYRYHRCLCISCKIRYHLFRRSIRFQRFRRRVR